MSRERLADGTFAPVHNGKHTKLYGVWCGMKLRCNNPHNKSYPRYGGRGIGVCKEWSESFASFMAWAKANDYREGLTIDRINPDGNYEPSNCRWVTTAQQNRNYSRNHFITYQGETKCLVDWADEFGINRATVLWRLKAGKSLDEVFRCEDGRRTKWATTIS